VGLCVLGLSACRIGSEPVEEAPRFAVQNLYVGADIATLLSADDPEDVPELVAREFANIRASDFPARAQAIASSLARHRPHLVGLQEVSSFRLQSPGDFLSGNAEQAEDVVLDYLPILLEQLGARGVEYREVARYGGMDVEVPLLRSDGGLDDIRLSDAGVILARADVATANPSSANYRTNLVVQVGGQGGLTVTLLGGWASVEATIAGTTYRFVTTHLESGDLAPEVQVAQARELLEALSDETLRVILAGDFGSTPDGSTTASYQLVRDAGFVDLWMAAALTAGREDVGAEEAGVTCCQAPNLRNAESGLRRRLDFVFFRDTPDRPAGSLVEAVMTRIGADPNDRTASGLWPSDHAGLVASPGRSEESDDD
jgi:hypothetical protein